MFANSVLNWRLARNLALLVVYYENRTDTSQPLKVVRPTPGVGWKVAQRAAIAKASVRRRA